MKRLLGVLIALLLVGVMATPAFAQGPRGGDRVCTGGEMTVGANEIVDNVILFGCGARISSGAQVLRDVVSFGGNVVIEKDVHVNRDVVVFGGNLDLAGEAGRDVTVFGGNVTLQPTAVVDGNLITSGGFTDQKPGAVVRGSTSRNTGFRVFPYTGNWSTTFPATFGGGVLGALAGLAFGLIRTIVYALALAALGALTVVFMPAQTKQVSDTAQTYAMPSMGVGCLTSFVAVTLGILLLITICGIPFGVLLLLALVIAWLFGWIALGRLIGEKLLEAFKVHEILPIVAVVVGVIVLTIVSYVPIIGWLVGLFIGLLGLGAVVLTRFGTRTYPPLTPAPAALAPVAPSAPVPPSDASASSG